jgi:hypothetical protein
MKYEEKKSLRVALGQANHIPWHHPVRFDLLGCGEVTFAYGVVSENVVATAQAPRTGRQAGCVVCGVGRWCVLGWCGFCFYRRPDPTLGTGGQTKAAPRHCSAHLAKGIAHPVAWAWTLASQCCSAQLVPCMHARSLACASRAAAAAAAATVLRIPFYKWCARTGACAFSRVKSGTAVLLHTVTISPSGGLAS